MSTPPPYPPNPAYPPPPGPWGPTPPPPPRRGIPKWLIGLIIAGVLVFIVAPVAALAVAGLGLFNVLNPPEASEEIPKPDFQGFDACSLITPRDAERAGARLIDLGPEEVTVVGRVVRTTEAGVPIDICEYGTEPGRATTVQVSVAPAAVLDADNPDLAADKRTPVPGIGDQAYQVSESGISGITVVVVRGTTQFSISARRPLGDSSEQDEHREVVLELARKMAGAVPAKLALPGAVAKGPCAKVDPKALTAGLGGPVTHSRSQQLDGALVCSYTSAKGRAVTMRMQASTEDLDRDLASNGDPIKAGKWKAWDSMNTVSVLDGKQLLEVDFRHSAELLSDRTPADYALAGAGADALLGS